MHEEFSIDPHGYLNAQLINEQPERLISPNSPEDLILQNPNNITTLKLEKQYSMNIEPEFETKENKEE